MEQRNRRRDTWLGCRRRPLPAADAGEPAYTAARPPALLPLTAPQTPPDARPRRLDATG
ncbi:uncharacterized protein METZ01_LOCUS348759, partial [marine metagenome]